MAKSTWKRVERDIAKFFGTNRTPLSGINSRHTASDTLHEDLFIEVKYRRYQTVISFWDDIEEEPAVINLKRTEDGSEWLLFHSKDFEKLDPNELKTIEYARKRFAVATIWDNECEKQAVAEDKTPVLALKLRYRHGFWLICRKEDLTKILEAKN